MSRAARNSKVIRSGAVGFVVGLATLGVVAHGSPAHALLSGTTSTVQSLADGEHAPAKRSRHAQTQDQWVAPQDQSQQDPYWQPQQDPSAQPQQDPYAQPQYQQPQQQYVQPAPSQQPQSQAS
ncbi:MAG: hypothetical protein ACR2J9_05365 [Gaiellales bacterium]